MKKGILTIITLICFQIIGFGNLVYDTITNWQFYKDSEMLFQSNIFDSQRNLAIINLEDEYQFLSFQIFYDFHFNLLNRKIELVSKNRVIIEFTDRNFSHSKFNLEKDKIEESIENDLNKNLLIRYTDKFHPKGLIIGEIKFIKNHFDVLQIKEIKEVLRLAIDLPSLQQYFHIEELPGRIPLIIQEFGLINSENLEGLMKFGEVIQFKSTEDLKKMGTSNYFGIGDWTLVGNKLRLQLYYPIEGIRINYMFEKKFSKWIIVNSSIIEE